MRRTALLALGAALVIALAIGGPAVTAKTDPNKDLWATVNICDTTKHPNDLGIRGRMPGNGTDQKMRMQFFVQYKDKATGKWSLLKQGGTSPWQSGGSAKFTWGENGFTFFLKNLKAGQKYTFRGFVNFEWRKNGNVVRSAKRYTSPGHPNSRSEPSGYSAASCVVTG